MHTNKTQGVVSAPYEMDFFPIGAFQETHPNGSTHIVNNTPIPEPGTMALIGLGLAGLVVIPRRKLK